MSEVKVVVITAAGPGEKPKVTHRRVQRKRLSPDERDFIWNQSNRCCYICTDDLPRLDSWHVEHIVAFSSDPAMNDVIGNMLASCPTCNLKKSATTLEDCVSLKGIFACRLDERAADADHLNTKARESLLRALEIKKQRFATSRGDLRDLDQALDAIEADVATGARDAKLIDGELNIDDESRSSSSGAFGEIFKAKWKVTRDGEFVERDVALKFPINGADAYSAVSFRDELRALARHGGETHPHIVQFIGCAEYKWQEGEPSSALCFEWCDFTLASNYVKRCAPLRQLLAQTASALAYLHENDWIHRDIKPMNILVIKQQTTWIAKLADFGCAKQLLIGVDEHTVGVGTGGFRAKELRTGNYGKPADVYSLGMTMKSLKQDGSSKLFKSNSSDLKLWNDVTEACCNSQPDQRVTAKWACAKLEESTGSREQVQTAATRTADVAPTAAVASSQTTFVYVVPTAKRPDNPSGTWGMKYHLKRGHYNATIRIDLADAENMQYGHKPCQICFPTRAAPPPSPAPSTAADPPPSPVALLPPTPMAEPQPQPVEERAESAGVGRDVQGAKCGPACCNMM